MTVHFIGAGPGAADLITLRGAKLLAACPVCLYAGSTVAPEILAHSRAIGEKYRKALATFDPSNHLAGHAVDDLVAGIETGPLAKTEALLQKIENHARSVAAETMAQSDDLYGGTLRVFGILIQPPRLNLS